MVEIRLHGPLAAQFGKVWNLEVSTPAEALRAIEVNAKGFLKKLVELDKEGLGFRLKTNTHDLAEDELTCKIGRTMKRLDIIPVVKGSSAVTRIIVGVALVAAAVYLGPAAYAVAGWGGTGVVGSMGASVLMGMGVSLALGGISELLTPKVGTSDFQNDSTQSWTLNGPGNTVDQGYPVPVIYGEVLTGGYVVSAGMSVAEAAGGVTDPTVKITGTLSQSPWIYPTDKATKVVFKLTTSTYNVDNANHDWTINNVVGSSAASAVIVPSGASAVVTVTVPKSAQGQQLSILTWVTVTGTFDGMPVTATHEVTLKAKVNVEDLLGYGG